MKEITFETASNQEIWELFDKTVEHVFIHKFNPHESVEWWNADLRIKNKKELNNISVRQMEFDLQTNLEGLKSIIELNTRQLRIYQLEKPIPDSLILERLPDKARMQILKQNGLKHFFWIDFEFITIESFDDDFIHSIESNPKYEKRIKALKKATQSN